MADETLASYKAKYGAIDKRLDAGQADQAVKGEIIGLFKSVEAQIADLTTLRDEIKALVDKWKASQGALTAAPPAARTRSSPRIDRCPSHAVR